MATAADVQEQMRQVRCELGEDVQDLVENARTMTDWKHYVRSYPLVCVGAAAALGFMIVPTRVQVIQSDAKALSELARQHKLVVKAESEPKQRKTLMASLAAMAVNWAIQGGMAVAKEQLNKIMSEQMGKRGQRDNGRGNA